MVRRAIYWSLLISPTAGFTYGGHGVWGWDDGSGPPVAHPNTGTPKPWREALHLPAAEQLSHLAALFASIPWWQLRPAPEILAKQPGNESPRQFIAAAGSETLAVIYTPEDRQIHLRPEAIAGLSTATWFNPRTGKRTPATPTVQGEVVQFETPGEGDWVLVLG
jgi:hypothetical protein